MIRLGYETLPTWAHWQVERYLALDDEQERIVSRRLDELHRWHRRTQLKQYVRFLREVDDELHNAVDADSIAAWRERVAQAWHPVAEHLAPGVAELAVTLRPEQIERLRKRLKESNETAREKQFPVDARREEARGDRIVKRAEFFLGRLDGDQERELRAMAARLPAAEEEWMAEREARQHRIVAMLERLSREQAAQDRGGAHCARGVDGPVGDPDRSITASSTARSRPATSCRCRCWRAPRPSSART